MEINLPSGVNLANWDNAPGCIRTDFNGIASLLRDEATKDPDNEFFLDTNVQRFTFMPTVSCLDINWPMDNTHIFKNIENAKIIENKLTPFEAFYAPATANLRHVEITTPMKDSLIQWITENERDLASLPNAKGAAYNFGYARKWIPSLSIYSGGTLRLNQTGATSYGAGRASYESTWETWLYDCGGSTVNIEEGGKFIIGSDTDSKKGIVHIPTGSVLNNIQGALKLQKDSEIIIEKGGMMNLKGGISDLHQASKITVQKDAILNITGGTLSLHDASQIIVQSGGKVIIAGGLSSLLATSQFVVEQGGIVEVKTDAALAITEQSRFDVKGKATFQDRSRTTISGKASMQASGEVRFTAGHLTMRDDALLQTNNQSLLVFNGEMNIQMNHFATIDVVDKATLRLDGSLLSPVRFKGGGDYKERTPIIIRECKWIINAPMEVSGSAFFQIAYRPREIQYLNNMNFSLNGDGKRLNVPFKMLELSQGVKLDLGGINMQDGKIEYKNNTHISYYSTSFFTNIYFKGNSNGEEVKAIANTGAITGTLNIANCLFEDVDHCVWISTQSNTPSGDINIHNTIAKRFKVLGFDFDLRANINISNCHFTSSIKINQNTNHLPNGSVYAPALRVNNMSRLYHAIVSNTIIENIVDWQHYLDWQLNDFDPNHNYSRTDSIYPPQTDVMREMEHSYLVGVFGVHNFEMSGSEVKDGYIGILTDMGVSEVDCPAATNIRLTCTNVHNNYTGIVIVNIKDPTPNCGNTVIYGGITLNSATIDDNVFGIYGKNVFLDANLTAVRIPSTFGIKGVPARGHYMCFSYSSLISPTGPLSTLPITNGQLYARNNYWRSGAPVINVNYLLGGYSIEANPAASMPSECILNERQSTDPAAVMTTATEEEKAFITVNGVTKALLPLYWKGTSEYLNGDIADAIATLSEITAIPLYLIRESDNPYLRSYHTLAWAIAPGPAVSDIGNQKIANIKNTNPMFVFPNPAEGFFKLVLPSGRYDVQLSDVLGRVIKQIQVADYEEISTENIQNGLYQITVRKQGEQAIFQTGKIVIKE